MAQLRTHERSGLLSQVFDLQLERDDGPPSIFPVLVRLPARLPICSACLYAPRISAAWQLASCAKHRAGLDAAVFGLDVPRFSCPQIRMSNHALPAWKAGLVVNMRQSIISSSTVMLVTTLEAAKHSALYFQIQRRRHYMHSITKTTTH